MGCVYRAAIEGPGGASKQVALKVIHAHLAEDQDFVLMFLDEMRVAMALSHRNIVQTFDAGEADERYYMVMELVNGGSLRGLLHRLKGRPLPLDVALFIGQEISAALAYAHRFQSGDRTQPGVVHRDLSPGNVLLSAEGDVKLADFGVAKAAGRLYVTKANLIRGKMQYMAPEQASGRAGSYSDIYSLGAVLYEMVTGKPARKATGLDELRLSSPPPPPSQVRSETPPALDKLVLSCLDPEPAARPRGADEVRRELAAVSVQLRSAGQGLDDHARLKDFLFEIDGVAERSRRPESPRLARMVLEQARAMETDPELEVSEVDEGAKTSIASAVETKTLTFDDDLPTPVVDDDVPTPVVDEDLQTHQGVVEEEVKPLEAVDTVEISPESEPSSFGGDFDSAASTFGSETTEAKTSPQITAGRRTRTRSVWLIVAAVVLFAVGIAVVLRLGTPPEIGPQLAAVARDAARGPDQLDGAAEAADLDQVMTPRPEPDSSRSIAVADTGARPSTADATIIRPRRRSRAAPRVVRGYGYLDINALPWAKVYVDGRYRGETPLEGLRLRAGVHTVRLVSPSRRISRTYQVRVQADKRRQRVFNLLDR